MKNDWVTNIYYEEKKSVTYLTTHKLMKVDWVTNMFVCQNEAYM